MKVYIIQHIERMLVLGCFDTMEKAKNYVGESRNLHIYEVEVE